MSDQRILELKRSTDPADKERLMQELVRIGEWVRRDPAEDPRKGDVLRNLGDTNDMKVLVVLGDRIFAKWIGGEYVTFDRERWTGPKGEKRKVVHVADPIYLPKGDL